MSRSVRTRRLTVYDTQSGGLSPHFHAEHVPPRSTSNQAASRSQQQQQQQHQQQDTVTSSQRRKGTSEASDANRAATARGNKATQVGSNLKKRLSTRYGDDRRSSRADMMIPAVPDLPLEHSKQGYVQSSYDRLVEGGGATSASGSTRRPLPILGDGFDEQQYDGGAHGRQGQDSLDKLISSNDNRSRDRNARGGHFIDHQDNLGLVPSITGSSSSSSRQPTLAWEGSALKKVLDSTRRYSNSSNLISLDKLRQQDHFSPTDYLRIHLPPNISTADFSETLAATKAAVKEDVKSQVFANYSDFIAISSQVGALENEMIELKSLLAEWRGMPRVLESQDESNRSLLGSSTVNTLARRSSLLSLQQVYRAQLTALWEGIDNSQRFIPYKPGRHLVAEAPDFVELNAATYRPSHNVALFLLDDLLLVATRKKSRVSTKVRLEAQRCFALGEIVVVDLKDSTAKSGSSDLTSASTSGSIKDSIKIKRGKEIFVYRAERSESKKALLNAFRRVAEELVNRRKKQGAGGVDGKEGRIDSASALGRRTSVYAGMGGTSGIRKSILGDLAEQGGGEDGVMKMASERVKEERKDPYRWLNDWSDGLAVDIALRRWKEACEKASKGKAVLSTYTPSDAIYSVLTTRLDTHISSLVSSLLSALQSPSLRKSSLITISSALNSLGYSSIARQTFLNAREDLLRKRKRTIKFEGDTELYVAELSMVVFGMVRNTSEWFMISWKETGMASGFVRWALSQIHSFALTFRRQVYGTVNVNNDGSGGEAGSVGNYDQATAIRARDVALESAQQLKDVGLDFGFVLNELLRSEEEQMALNLARFRELPDSAAGEVIVMTGASGNEGAVPETPSSGGSYETAPSGGGPPTPSRRAGRVIAREGDSEGYTPAPTTNRRRAVDLTATSSSGGAASSSGTTSLRPVRSLRQGSSQPLPIPSLTLTLADEASGISHRISSADLPNVTAQEIRRKSVLVSGGSTSPTTSSAGSGKFSLSGMGGMPGALESVEE